MKVKYEDGPLRRDIPLLGISCERGEEIDVPTKVGKQLIEQGWIGDDSGGSKSPTKAEIQEELEEKGIPFTKSATKAQLEELLKNPPTPEPADAGGESTDSAATPVEPDTTPAE